MSDKIKNVLLLSLEDLNDWIEPLGGHPEVRTPNLSRLASRSLVFTSAQSPAPACGPSRTATMFGQAPWRTGIYANRHKWQAIYRDSSVSLPGTAKGDGWTTQCAGRIFYRDVTDGWAWSDQVDAERMSGRNPHLVSQSAKVDGAKRFHDFGELDGRHSRRDRTALKWITRRMQPGAERMMWALGLQSTHLPFTAPPDAFAAVPEHPQLPPGLKGARFDPEDARELAGLSSGGLAMVEPLRERGRTLHQFDEYETFVRSYLACIAYTDRLVGQLLDHLEATGLLDDTLIVLWSDHGWQFGEKQAFSKFTLWERALRVPFMFSGPGIAPRRIDAPVSLLDLYPTVAALLGLAPPHDLDGQDLSPVLLRGEQPAGQAISAYALNSDLREPSLSIRTRDFRFTRYGDGSLELYDHASDRFEHTNLLAADGGGNLSAVVADLMARLPATPVEPQS